MSKDYSENAKLASNIFFISLEWIAITVFSFLFWFVIGKRLPPSDYGIISVFVNFTTIIGSLISIGTSVALSKLIPEYLEKKQFGKITSSIRFTIKLILLVTLVVTTGIYIFSSTISTTLKIPLYTVFLLPLSLFFFSMFNHQTDIMLGFQHTRKLAISSSIGNFLKFVVSTGLILLNMKFWGPIIGLIVGLSFIVFTRINYLFYNKTFSPISGKTLIMKFGIPALLAKLTTILLISGGPLILALFHTPEVVGVFGIGMLLTSQISVVPNVFSSALFPIISSLSAFKNQEKKQSYLINMTLRYALLITLPLLIFVAVFSGKLIVLISQVSYLGAKPLIPILSIGSLFLGISYIFTNTIYAIGKPDIQRNIIIMTSLLYLTLAFPLTYFLSLTGISIAYATTAFIVFAVSLFYLKKLIAFKISLKNIMKLLFANIISFGILFFISYTAANIYIGILYTLIVGALYLILLLFVKFYTSDDIKLINFMTRRFPIVKPIADTVCNILVKFTEN